jgi:hypothetical protein
VERKRRHDEGWNRERERVAEENMSVHVLWYWLGIIWVHFPQLIGPFDKAAEYDHVRVSFLCRKAGIVIVACTRFGKDLSEQAGIDVVARMLRMRERLEMVGGNFWKQKSHFNAQIHEKRVRKFGQTKINRVYDSSTQGERKEPGEKQERKDQTN